MQSKDGLIEEGHQRSDGSKKVTNINVLIVTAILFAVFVVAEIIGALVIRRYFTVSQTNIHTTSMKLC